MSSFTIKTYTPTWQEFTNFAQFIDTIERDEAHHSGLAKIIPPKEWIPRQAGYDLNKIDIKIKTPIKQKFVGSCGIYEHQSSLTYKPFTIKEFENFANSNRYRNPYRKLDLNEIERKYWKTLPYLPPLYGADVTGSLMDSDLKHWNFNNFGTILENLKNIDSIEIEGINIPFLYFGMWKTTFPWHSEDMDLYSVNYLHFGAPKTWYAIPPKYGRSFELLVRDLIGYDCPGFLRHKSVVMAPEVLKRHGIPCNKIVQHPNEIMVTFPFGYHSGYNNGFNCAEAVNFATPRWVEYGKRALQCSCSAKTVKITMNTFVKIYQPELYEKWMKGEDFNYHPEEPIELRRKSSLRNNFHCCTKNSEI